MSVNGVRILAHRGGAITSPENTLESLDRAKAEGADGVEIDVQLSADGEPFIFHDNDGRRLTGRSSVVGALPWRELRRLKVLGRYRIPHLTEALEKLENWPGATLTLDLHQESLPLAETVARVVGACSARSRIAVLGFYHRRSGLLRVREVDPRVRIAVMPGPPWLIDASVRRLNAAEVCIGWQGSKTRWLYRTVCRFYDARAAILRARKTGAAVGGGIANTPDDVRYFVDQGVDGIWTDDLEMTRRTLERI